MKDDSTSTAAALLSTNSSPSSPSCCYCHQPHPSTSCSVVACVEERKQILRRTGRCFVCLKKYHISKQCRSTGRCRNYGGRHHSSICSKASSGVTPTPSRSPHTECSASPSQGLDPRANEFKPVATNLYTSASVGVLLQTARAEVFNPEQPHSCMTMRMILDSGSQRSYITCKARDALLLPTVNQRRLVIKTFGSSQEGEHCCDTVRIAVKTVDGNVLELQLFVVPLICEPLTNQSIALCQSEYPHLAHL